MHTLITLICITNIPFVLLLFDRSTITNPIFAVGNIAGYIAGVLIAWELLLGIRMVSKIFSNDIVTMLKVHKYIGIYSIVGILLHPFIQMLAYGEKISFLYRIEWYPEYALHIMFGRLALLCGLVVVISGIFSRTYLSFRIWKKLHFFSFPFAIFTFVHAYDIGSYLQAHTWVFAYWTMWFVVVIGVMCYRIVHTVRTVTMAHIVTAITMPTADTLILSCKVPYHAPTPRVGQFAYIRTGLLSESHPFSIALYNKHTQEITFVIRVQGPFTTRLTQLAVGDNLYIDGYYGVYLQSPIHKKNLSRVIIAAGVGIAPFVDFVRTDSTSNTFLLYGNRTQKHAVFSNIFRTKLGERYLDIISHEPVTENEVTATGFISQSIIERHIPKSIRVQAYWYICGGPGFTQHVLGILRSMGIAQKYIFMEEFSF